VPNKKAPYNNKFGPSLRWMLYEAVESGLRVDPYPGKEWTQTKPTPSMNLLWRLLEFLPLAHLSYENEEDTIAK
jgi:hypothetical protein